MFEFKSSKCCVQLTRSCANNELYELYRDKKYLIFQLGGVKVKLRMRVIVKFLLINLTETDSLAMFSSAFTIFQPLKGFSKHFGF